MTLPLLTQTSPVDFIIPWNKPLYERLKQLKSGTHRVAYYSTIPDYATFRYRVYNMVQVINRYMSNTSAAFFFQVDLAHIDLTKKADVLVISRSKYTPLLADLVSRFKCQNKLVLFDIDDLIVNLSYVPDLMAATQGYAVNELKLDYWFATVGRLNAMLELCDQIITTNLFLQKKITEVCSKQVKIIPNFFNQEQESMAKMLWGFKQHSYVRQDKIYLGYFSGSSSHQQDLGMIACALKQILTKNPHVYLILMGAIKLPKKLSKLKKKIIYYPLQNFVDLQRYIAAVDINLIPLRPNIFNDCKSELKYFEAGIVGTLSVASPSYIYQQIIQSGHNGYLAKSYEWEAVLAHVIDNFCANDSLVQQAYHHSVKFYSPKNQTLAISHALMI